MVLDGLDHPAQLAAQLKHADPVAAGERIFGGAHQSGHERQVGSSSHTSRSGSARIRRSSSLMA
jgi:hypothetical protein